MKEGIFVGKVRGRDGDGGGDLSRCGHSKSDEM